MKLRSSIKGRTKLAAAAYKRATTYDKSMSCAMDLRNEGRRDGRSWKLPDVITKAGAVGRGGSWSEPGLTPGFFIACTGLFAGS
ncbi:hypothetical protein, partial [Methylobacterium oryzihabitans]|uniref:hypothetical protein n=1 Tax=Methylobacterium oryzihabitans TaxID=2499852 RepID=UPI001AED9D7E